MISFNLATRKIVELATDPDFSLPLEYVCLSECSGRTIGDSVYSPENLPAFTNSSMDGFAVNSEILPRNKSVTLDIMGESSAGSPWPGLTERRACRIMTGAPLPEGADAVIKIEDTNLSGNQVTLPAGIIRGQNCRYAGEDIKKGELIFRTGDQIKDTGLILAAALGFLSLPVFGLSSAAVIPTGNEISSLKNFGSIRNSTSLFLLNALRKEGCQATLSRPVPDNPGDLLAALREHIEGPSSLIITTGGVSAGDYDYIPSIVADLGGTIHFHRVSMRPGKPVLCATFAGPDKRKKILFGLPGNPVSTVTGFNCFVRVFLRALRSQNQAVWYSARLVKDFPGHAGLSHFIKGVAFNRSDEILEVAPCEGQGSHQVGDFARMNCWIFSPKGQARLQEGEWVRIMMQE